jgi:cyclopropane fatty-acyl-phospholipid synthase-like methyltransferase
MEHIKNSRIEQFISECCRITKKGGVNIHVLPNLRAQCAAMARLDKWTHHEINTIFAGDENPKSSDPHEGYHHTGMSPELAVDMFKAAGFSEVVVWEYPRYLLEMIIEAWK